MEPEPNSIDGPFDVEESKPEKPPGYQSKQGYEVVPLRRGFTEITPLFAVLSEHGGVICGGFARYAASPRETPEQATDVDVYCENPEIFEKVKAALLAVLIQKHENDMAISFERPKEGPWSGMPLVQLIKPLVEGRVVTAGDFRGVLDNFDFTVARAAIISATEVLVDADFMHDEPARLLRLKNIHCPVSSMLRCMKYSFKGYWMRPFEALKLFLDWEERSPMYREKIRDFLVRVDGEDGLSQQEINDLEALMRID